MLNVYSMLTIELTHCPCGLSDQVSQLHSTSARDCLGMAAQNICILAGDHKYQWERSSFSVVADQSKHKLLGKHGSASLCVLENC